jgi:hypothetical protein
MAIVIQDESLKRHHVILDIVVVSLEKQPLLVGINPRDVNQLTTRSTLDAGAARVYMKYDALHCGNIKSAFQTTTTYYIVCR